MLQRLAQAPIHGQREGGRELGRQVCLPDAAVR